MALDKVKYWTDLANYDIDTADLMFSGGRWLYVGFMCHQAIEKVLKAHWCAVRDDDTPYLHNLIKLATSCGLITKMTHEQQNLIASLMPMNIEARYPSYKENLSSKMNEAFCKQLLEETKALKSWIESKH